MAGALWSAAGSAEAGVSAGSAAKATFDTGGGSHATTVGSLIGTGPAAAKISLIQGPIAERFACGAWWASGFSTKITLASGWSSANVRNQPCTSGSVNAVWGGSSQEVLSQYKGDRICRGSSYSQSSSIWYRINAGFVWSGATSRPNWNYSYC